MIDLLGGILGGLVSAGAALAQDGAHAAESAHAIAPHAPAIAPRWILAIPFLPLLACVLCGLCAAGRVRSKLPAWITVACLGAAFGVTLAMYRSLGDEPGIAHAWRWFDLSWGSGEGQRLRADFSFYIDSLTCLWMLFVTGLGALIALYASEYMAGDAGPGYCRFFAAFSLFVFSMSCLVMADNLVLLYLGWEGVGLCSYLLIGYHYTRPSAVAAAKKAFIMNRVGDLGLALGVFLAFVQFGTVEYAGLFREVGPYVELARAGRFDEIPFTVQAIPLLLTVGAFGKSAQLFLYTWLPDAMEGPTPVSALIHAATMVTAGVYLVARAFPLFQASEHALSIVAWSGAITALWSATIGMAQFDIKRIMAYSTISQLGYMFAGLGVLTTVGAAFHVFTHAFFKALLFLACGAVMHGFAGQLDLRKLSGVRRIPGWGVVGVCMLVGCLNLAGFPLVTSGFWSKDMILAEAFAARGGAFQGVGWILLLTAGLTAYYTFRVYFRVFEGPVQYEPGDEAHAPGGHGHEDAHADPHGHAHDKARGTHDGHAHAPGDFHPHAPGWAINSVLVILAVLATLAVGAYFVDKEHHGWVGSMVHGTSAHVEPPHLPDAHGGAGHGTFLGLDPHAAMYYVSAAVGLAGIAAAFALHLRGRTDAARAKADDLLPALGPIPRWAQGKWYVDELYDFLFRRPLHVLSMLFALVDSWLVDGLVNVGGMLPRWTGQALRPSQGGQLHGYAAWMAGGIGVLLLIVWVWMP